MNSDTTAQPSALDLQCDAETLDTIPAHTLESVVNSCMEALDFKLTCHINQTAWADLTNCLRFYFQIQGTEISPDESASLTQDIYEHYRHGGAFNPWGELRSEDCDIFDKTAKPVDCPRF